MSEINPAKPVQKMNDIDDCPDERALPRGSSILMVGGDSSKPATFAPQFVALPFNPLRADPNFRTWWNPDVNDFNQMAAVLRRVGWRSVCRQGEGERPELIVSKTVGKPTGIFDGCNDITTAQRKPLPISLSSEEARYLASRLPTKKDGCSEVGEDGAVMYKFLTEPSSIKMLTDNIQKDIDLKKLPEGVTKKRAEEIIKGLKIIADADPFTVQFNNTLKQFEMMDKQLNRTTWLQIGSIVVMGLLIYWQGNRMKSMMGEKPKLSDFTSDLVEEQRKRLAENREKAEIRGRDAEAIEYLEALDRPEYANPILVGESGAGKDEIVRRAAQLIALNDPRVPERLRGKKIIAVDPTALQAGTKFVGSTSERTALLKKAMESGEIIYMEELADFMSIGSHSGGTQESLGSQLKPVMTKKWSHWSGSTTPRNLEGLLAQNPDLKRRAPIIHVTPLDVARIRQIFEAHIAPGYAEHYRVRIGREAVEAAVEMGLVYAHRQNGLPRVDAVKQTLMGACAIAQKRGGSNPEFTKEDIASSIRQQFRIRKVDPSAKWEEPVEAEDAEGAEEGAEPKKSGGIPSIEELAEGLRTEDHLKLIFDGYNEEQLKERARIIHEKLVAMSAEDRAEIFMSQGSRIARVIPVGWVVKEMVEALRKARAEAGESEVRREEGAQRREEGTRRGGPEAPAAGVIDPAGMPRPGGTSGRP